MSRASFFFFFFKGKKERRGSKEKKNEKKPETEHSLFVFLELKKKTGKHEYEQGGGIALEAQDLTDFLHHPEFPTCILEPGQAMTRVFELRWGVASAAERKKDGASCGAAAEKKEEKKATASSDKSAVGAEEMMM